MHKKLREAFFYEYIFKTGEDFSFYDIMKSAEFPNPGIDLLKDCLIIEINAELRTLTNRESDFLNI